MSVSIKSERELGLMREAGRILAITHDEMEKALKPGVSTWEIDRLGEEIIRGYGCIPSFKNYRGYPASICISVNNEVVHGIPSKKRILKEGDIVSLDAGVIYKGYHSDAARTHGVGRISSEASQLIQVTKECFFEGIKYAAIISMTFPPPSRHTRKASDTGWSETWWDTASAPISTRTRRCRISRQKEKA